MHIFRIIRQFNYKSYWILGMHLGLAPTIIILALIIKNDDWFELKSRTKEVAI